MVVKNTKVDIDRNEMLLAASYEFFEIETTKIRARQNAGETPTKDETEFMKICSHSNLYKTRQDT